MFACILQALSFEFSTQLLVSSTTDVACAVGEQKQQHIAWDGDTVMIDSSSGRLVDAQLY
jgi:hypothetical protein